MGSLVKEEKGQLTMSKEFKQEEFEYIVDGNESFQELHIRFVSDRAILIDEAGDTLILSYQQMKQLKKLLEKHIQ